MCFIGSLKMMLSIYIVQYGAGTENLGDESHANSQIQVNKALNYLYVFILEDCVELFLEYFYVEKYLTLTPPWYIIARDSVIAVIAFVALISEVVSMWDMHKDGTADKVITVPLFSCTIANALLHFLHVGGAGYQYVTGKLNHACLRVVDGWLVQFQFASGCLQGNRLPDLGAEMDFHQKKADR